MTMIDTTILTCGRCPSHHSGLWVWTSGGVTVHTGALMMRAGRQHADVERTR